MAPSSRDLCLRALVEWEKGRSFADEILHGLMVRFQPEAVERGLFTELFYGVLRHLRVLDVMLGWLRDGELDVSTKSLVRMGLYQIFHTRIPEHAAVFETVKLSRRARGVVNAVLRRACRERATLEKRVAGLSLAERLSMPDFLVDRWVAQFGEKSTEELCEWNNRAAETYFRVNRLRTTREQLLKGSQDVECFQKHESVVRVKKIPTEWLEQGLGYVQDPSTLMAVDLLDPQAGEVVLDACAAPGGKTTYIADRMGDKGKVLACEIYESRAERLRENLKRLRIGVAEVLVTDFLMAPEEGSPLLGQMFDRILLDVPCSNTGVIRRRVDVRWRLTEEDFVRMPFLQFAMVRRAVPLLKSGGVLVYSTCSLESEENDGVVEQVKAAFPELVLEEVRRHLPFRDVVDGAFAARFRKV